MSKPVPSRWPELWAQALSIMDQANAHGPVLDRWSFGGGTALMLRIGHRESHDIDLFVDDPQVLPLLNPQTQHYRLDPTPSGYDTDGAGVLKIVFHEIGEIDFICGNPLTAPYAEARDVCGRQAWVETAEEIIAKKVFHRGGRLQPRDMFDIAAVVRRCGPDSLVRALQPYRRECGTALAAAERFDPDAAAQVIGQLLIRVGFEDLPPLARTETMSLLRSVLAA